MLSLSHTGLGQLPGIPQVNPLNSQQEAGDQAQMFRSELLSRGITEREAYDYLAQKGIFLNELSPTDLITRRDEIKGHLLELEKEKKLKAPEGKKNRNDDLKFDFNQDNLVKQDSQKLTKEELAKKVNEKWHSPEIYGHSLFDDKNIRPITADEGAKAPETYVLAAGDELRVSIFGLSQADILLEVEKEGFIQPASMPKIYVQGLSLAEARKLLRNRFGSYYRFNADQFALTLQRTRTISVNIFGEVKKQGAFSMSALNSAINALAGAGGVTDLASVREIELIRGKTRRKLDVYAFLENPGTILDFSLQQNDILFVPVAQRVVSIQGAVKRPMRYEILAPDDLQRAVRLAGGPLANASPDFVQVERFEGDSMITREYALSDVLEGKFPLALKDGDTIRLRAISRFLDNFVEVNGAVIYPGKYSLGKESRLLDILEKARVRKEAIENVLFVERYQTDNSVRLIKVNTNLEPGFTLQPRDKVLLLEKAVYANMGILTISGSVRNPFTRELSYENQLPLADALLFAGGLKPEAADYGYVFRSSWYQPGVVEYLRVDVRSPGDFLLRAGDQLIIYARNEPANAGEISVTGAVKLPLTIQFHDGLHLPDVLSIAGGITSRADLSKIDVFRLKYAEGIGSSFQRLSIAVDSSFKVLPDRTDFKIYPFDQIAVREKPFFKPERNVHISGEIKYPGIYSLKFEKSFLSDIIREAGGLSSTADPNNAFLFRKEGSIGKVGINLASALQNPRSIIYDPVIISGDSILIKTFNNILVIRLEGTRLGDLTDKKLTLDKASEKADAQTYNFSGRKKASWYIKRFVGGFSPSADRSSVTLTFPDGRVESTKRLFLFRNYPYVEPGSMISLTTKPVKPASARLFNIERILGTTTQGITTVATLLLLLKQI